MSTNSHITSDVDKCELITLDKHTHENGNLSVIENGLHIPFDIKRVYYLYDIPGGEERGGHSHHECHELIIAVSGSFNVEIDDGVKKRVVTLNRSNVALHAHPGIWRTLNNFSSGSICLVLASDKYCEADYVREYEDFKSLTQNKKK